MMCSVWKYGVILATSGVALLFAARVSAHPPFCICKTLDAMTVRCEGGFANGADVPGIKLDVIRYDETVVLETKFGADSTVTFKRPEGEFYILFDAGAGQSFDVDYKDIE